MTTGTWHDAPGDTPVTDVPPDYYPQGSARWFEIPDGREAGKRLFVRDSVHDAEGAGDGREAGVDPDHTVVFVHGNPECSYTYRHVIDHVVEGTDDSVRIVATDHVGFGLSDTADYEMVSMDHARNLEQVIAALDLQNVTLVVHDWGGPIGVGAFLRRPELVDNLVVANSTVFPLPDDGYTYHGNYPTPILPCSRVPVVIPDALWGEVASYVVFRTPCGPAELHGELLAYVVGRRLGWVPAEEPWAHRVFAAQFRDRSNARSSKRLVRQTPHWGTGNVYEEPTLGPRDTAPFYDEIQERIGQEWGSEGRDIGVRAVVGRWDPCGKPSVLEQWRNALPQLAGGVTAFADVGHFVEEERPATVGDAVLELLGR